MKPHVTVIGGGAIGLSLAYELLRRGYRVRLLERSEIGREASWAGAGILAPAHPDHSLHPLDRLAGLGSRLHREWAERLRNDYGLDVGYWNCGGLYIARSPGEAAALRGQADSWEAEHLSFRKLTPAELTAKFGGRLATSPRVITALWTDEESQIRNPHFIRSLTAAVMRDGGEILEQLGELRLQTRGNRIWRVESASGWAGECELLCLAAGTWTGQLLEQLAIALPVEPIRGQMALFQIGQPLPAIINEGSRYLVPRKDGHLLVGSTMEEAGFDRSTTELEQSQLVAFARSLVPELAAREPIRSWAGLRPASYDGFPYLGAIPDWDNLFVSTGHLRSGLQLAPASAVLLAELIAGGGDPELLRLLSPARLGRHLDG
ncbi:MAG: NAD(P)/FAD-dependent oxidoreductase [Planctomycetota bacterium]